MTSTAKMSPDLVDEPPWWRCRYAGQRWRGGFERILPAAATAAIHLLVLAWLLSSHAAPVIVRPSLSTLTLPLAARSAPAAPARPTPPPLPTPQASDEPKPPELEVPVTAEVPDTDGAQASGPCAPLEVVTKAIADDADTRAAILLVPTSERSISQAIIIWNAGWVDSVSGIDGPLATTRAAIVQTLLSVPSQCLDEPVMGPRLIQVPIDQGVAFLVIGSGRWMWRQLAENLPQSPGASPAIVEMR